MKVNELVAKSPVDEITVKIDEKGEPRDVRGGTLTVCDCTVSDDTGSVTLTLWNAEIAKVEVGDTCIIKKGWVNEFQGKKQLSAGRFGEMEVQKGDGAPAKKDKKADEEPAEEEKKPEEVLEAVEDDII
jgi:ssDNA-binding replication factor A large subunit